MKSETVKVALTKARVNALPVPAAGRAYTYDTRTPGMCVCTTATGTRTFYLYRWHSGRPERKCIGRFPDLSVEQARAEVRRLTGLMVQPDFDPKTPSAPPAKRRRWAKCESIS